jgi:hypothetical protein
VNKLAITAATLFVAVSNLGADILYAPTQIGSSARVSDYGSADDVGFRSFDNFALGSSASVEKISWTGFWMDFGNPVPAAAPSPDVLSWDIAFHADNAGVPGPQLFLESFSAANVSSGFLGTGIFTAGSSYNVSFYQYSAELTAPFSVTPATQYWVSVLSRSDVYNPAFVLRGATGGDDSSYQQQLGAGLSVVAAGAVARDRAFVLEGTVVPEPSTVGIGAVGLLLLPILQRRLRRASQAPCK